MRRFFVGSQTRSTNNLVYCACGEILVKDFVERRRIRKGDIEKSTICVKSTKGKFKNVFKCSKCRFVVFFELSLTRGGYSIVRNHRNTIVSTSAPETTRPSGKFQRKRFDYVNRGGRKSWKRAPASSVKRFDNFFRLAEDLRRFQLFLKKDKKRDCMDFVSEKSDFYENVLNGDHVGHLEQKHVNLIITILVYVFENSIHSPRFFIKNHLTRTKFLKTGLDIYIRSKYFVSLFDIEGLCKLIKCMLKASKTLVKKLPFASLEQCFQSDPNELVKEVLQLRDGIMHEIGDESEDEDEDEEKKEEGELYYGEKKEFYEYKYGRIIPSEKDFEKYDENALPEKNVFLWSSEKEYLSCHYHLIKEDFIRPLKEGWDSWLKHCEDPVNNRHDFRDLHVYVNCKIKRYSITSSRFQFEVHFNVPQSQQNKKFKSQGFRVAKSFLRNSLVVLFENNREDRKFIPIVCTVNDNDTLYKYQVGLTPYDYHEFRKLDVTKEFTMIESPAFFSAYESVLLSLQEMENVPFKNVLLFGKNEDNTPPAYIINNPEINFAAVANEEEIKKKIESDNDSQLNSSLPSLQKPKEINGMIVDRLVGDCDEQVDLGPIEVETVENETGLILEKKITTDCLKFWPETKYTCLNDSENVSLKEVFRKRFSLIQGGPGTGKTYIGRKIAAIMQQNKHIPKPIVVICYTNHALDSFLVPLLDEFPDLIRVGSRTKSQDQRYLQRQIKVVKRERMRSSFLRISKSKIRDVEREIRRFSNDVEVLSSCRFDIRNFRELMYHYEDYFSSIAGQYQNYVESGESNTQIIKHWLDEKLLKDLFEQHSSKKKRKKMAEIRRREMLRERERQRKIELRKRREIERMRAIEERRRERGRKKREKKRKLEEAKREIERRKIEKEKRKKLKLEFREKKKVEREMKQAELVKKKLDKLSKKNERELERQRRIMEKEREMEKRILEIKKRNLERRVRNEEKEKRNTELRRRNEVKKIRNEQKRQILEEKRKKKEERRKKIEEKKKQKFSTQMALESVNWENEDEFPDDVIQQMKMRFKSFQGEENDLVGAEKDEEEKVNVAKKDEEAGGENDEEEDFYNDEEAEDSDEEIEFEEYEKEETDFEVEEPVPDRFILEESEESEVESEGEFSSDEEFDSEDDEEEIAVEVTTLLDESDDDEEEEPEIFEEEMTYVDQTNETNDDIREEMEKDRLKEEEIRKELLEDTLIEFDDVDIPLDEEDDRIGEVSTQIREFFEEIEKKLSTKPWKMKNRKMFMEGVYKKFTELLSALDEKIYDKLQELFTTRNDLNLEIELDILKNASIIGITSTMCAIRRRLFNRLGAKSYLIEEAAELLEGQIVATLPRSIEHCILIGDYKQLKPKFNVWDLQKCNIDVSLFERSDKIGINPRSLLIQQRMRPEISHLMIYLYYPKMKNHESVTEYPSVVGHDYNLQFISHDEIESQGRNSRSKFNHFEANFVVNHALFILKHGSYKSKNITILTPYKGQMFLIRRIVGDLIKSRENNTRNLRLGDMRVETVDDFQGEENEIIIVSLVRSKTKFKNKKERIGFLKVQNRIIVLLSRAKHGCYIYGNSALLQSCSGDWEKVLQILRRQDKVKDHLAAKCENHPHVKAKISNSNEFKRFSCTLEYGFEFQCGHACKIRCHFPSNNHRCRSNCSKKLECGHFCERSCHYPTECVCRTIVDHEFECGHVIPVLCSTDKTTLSCSALVDYKLSCGHVVQRPCGTEEDEILCKKSVKYRLPCGHRTTKECHEVIEDLPLERRSCQKKCKKKMDCGHRCQNYCVTCTTSGGHAKCPKQIIVKCERCEGDLYKICSDATYVCRRKCKFVRPCGHQCRNGCQSCFDDKSHGNCRIVVREKCPKCFGNSSKLCFEKVDQTVKNCANRCNFKMICGHPCSKKCKDCDGMHECDQTCRRMRICGHRCRRGARWSVENHRCGESCADNVCLGECKFVCSHGVPCNRRCGESCWRCNGVKVCRHKVPRMFFCERCKVERNRTLNFVNCTNRCEHRRCTKKCCLICNVEPCFKRCKNKLRCGHRCQSFCGEVCPPCLICDKKWKCPISGEKFEGKNTRLPVFILPCRCVFFAHFLDDALLKHDEMVFRTCPNPNCRKEIADLRCHRYQYVIKVSFFKMNNLKRIVKLGKMETNEKEDRIQKFVQSIGKGILKNIFEFQSHKERDVSVVDRFVNVMEKFLSFGKILFFESRIQWIEDIFISLIENYKLKGGESVSVPRIIAKLINTMLLQASKRRSDEKKVKEKEHNFKNVLLWLKLIKEKDLFFDIYQNLLAYRLLQGVSSHDDEKWVIDQINRTCDVFMLGKKDFKLMRMIKDLKYSGNLRKEYKNEFQSQIDFSVKVLTSGIWPKVVSEMMSPLRVSPIIVDLQGKFEDFYSRKHSNRDLRWIFSGTNEVELIALYPSKKYIIKVSGVQACILLLFNQTEEEKSENQKKELTLEDVSESIGIKKLKDLNVYLQKIASKKKGRLLVFTEKKFSVYNEFSRNRKYLELVSPSLSDYQVEKVKEGVLEDRKFVIDAAITRIMKKVKKLDKRNLMTRVIEEIKLFKPSVKVIGKRIRLLVEKKYLKYSEHDKNRLIYIA